MIELADKVIALGVGEHDDIGDYVVTGTWDSDGESCIAEVFVHDWRVAGALLERMSCVQISQACKQSDGLFYHGWLKDPHKIIVVCVEILTS